MAVINDVARLHETACSHLLLWKALMEKIILWTVDLLSVKHQNLNLLAQQQSPCYIHRHSILQYMRVLESANTSKLKISRLNISI